MESEDDEYIKLYGDVLPPPSPSYPVSPLYTNVDTNTTISSSRNELSHGKPKTKNDDEFEIHEGFVENEDEKKSKDVNFTSMSHFNSNEGTSLVKSENYGTVDENDEAENVNVSTLSHSENGKGYENDEKSSVDDLKCHPMILELMSSLSENDVCDDGSEDEVNLRVLEIASDCGIGVENDGENDSGSNSEDCLNLSLDDEEFVGCNGVDEKGEGTCKSGILGNVTSYDDYSYDYQDNWTGLGRSREDVLHTRSDFYLPSNQTIFDINIDDLKEKGWRRPGVDLTDYFNFGLKEQEWKGFCKKMRKENNLYQQAETSYTKMNATNKDSQGKVAGNSYEHRHFRISFSHLPLGEAIQVQIGVAERLPSIETEFLRLSNSDTVIEIIVHDNSDNNKNAEKFRNMDKDVIRPYPLDCYNPFPLVYAQLTCPPAERNWKGDRVEEATHMRHKNRGIPKYYARNNVKDEIQLGTTKRHNSLCQVPPKKPIRVYRDKNDPKDESWRDHVAKLIQRYGEDNRCTDLVRKYGKDKLTTPKYPNTTTKDSRMNKRRDLCTFGPTKSVWDRVSDTPKTVKFKGNENKRPRSEEKGRNIWSGKRLRKHDSESEQEEGEIIRVERRNSKGKAIDCRSNYHREKVIYTNYRKNPRRRTFP